MFSFQKKDSGLSKDSVALVHQIIVVDKTRLETKLAKLPKDIKKKIENEIDFMTTEEEKINLLQITLDFQKLVKHCLSFGK